MKKAKLLGFGLCVVMFTASLVSCANGADSSSSDTTPAATPAPAATTPAGGSGGSGSGGSGGGNNGGSSGANQTAINNAAEGASITLSGTDTQLTITRGITVNGGGLSGATVTVSPSVARNVTLRNFTNSNIRVANVSNTNSSINTVNNGVFSSVRSVFGGIFRSDNTTGSNSQAIMGTTSGETFKKIVDESVPLFIENCTINEFEADGKVALYLEKGDGKKSNINTITLKDNASDFSFIEFDDNGKEIADKTATPYADKSKVGNLIIDKNGNTKVNLIGGSFDNVGFGNNSSAQVDLKYDKELEDDQLHFSDNSLKEAFLNNSKITNKEDVGIAKHANNSGVYKFTMTRNEFNSYNGKITIVFMTNDQKNTVITKQGSFTYFSGAEGTSPLVSVATYTNPVYAAIPAGHFKIFDTTSNGIKVIQGSEFAYGDYAHAAANGHPNWLELADIVVLTKYRNYNKEAFIINLGADYVDIYVNTAAIKKTDLLTCVGQIGNESPKVEFGTKVSEMDLSQYTPYLAVNRNIEGFSGGGPSDTVTLNNQTAIISHSSDLPYCNAMKFSDNDIQYAIFTMEPNATYPSDIPATYPTITVPQGLHHNFEDYFNQPSEPTQP